MESYGFLLFISGMLAFSQGQISVFAQTVPGVGSTPPTAVRYALLLKELAAVTEGRATLEARVHRYQQAYTALKRRIDAQKASCTCFNATTVAFTAHLDKDVSVLGIDQPLPFDNVTLNDGNAYDARHAQFRAPFNGTYQFYVSIATRAGYLVAADVMLNGNPVVKLRTGNQNQVNSATTGVTLTLNAGDDVWVQHDHAIADSNRLFYDEGFLTTFTGHLVNKM